MSSTRAGSSTNTNTSRINKPIPKTFQENTMSNNTRHSQAYYSSKHHPVVLEAQREAGTKLPYPHTRAERIEELKLQLSTVEPDTYLERFVKSYLYEAESLSDEEYQVKIDDKANFDSLVKEEEEKALSRKTAVGTATGFVGVKVRED
ncbi:hypothetical protein HAYMO_107 [Serratia phage vB_SmaM_Haymo]|nr:hypothetical protein HAYMO_107 [Serratia phage vB_SmaM_Haymo]